MDDRDRLCSEGSSDSEESLNFEVIASLESQFMSPTKISITSHKDLDNASDLGLPAVLLPIRSTSSNFYFSELTSDDLTPVVINKLYDIYMKHDTKYYQDVVGGIGKSIRILAKAYSISQSSLSFWFKKIRDEKPLRPALGPQDKLSDTVKDTTLAILKSRGNSSNNVARSGELKRIIEDQIEEESLSNALIKNNTISDRSVRAFRVSNDVVAMTPKAKTGARIRNECDPRNHYSLYCLISAFAAKTPNQGIYNFDATTFEVNLSRHLGQVLKLKEENQLLSVPAARQQPSDMAIFIKWLFLTNADGDVAPIVLLVQLPGIEKGSFILKEIDSASLPALVAQKTT